MWVGHAASHPWPSAQAGHALAGGDGCSLCALAPCLWSISRVVAPFGGTIDLGLEYERNRTILASRRCPPRSRRLTVPSNTCQGAEMVTPRGGPFLAFREESRWWEGWEARRGPSRARGEGRSMANHLPAPHPPSRHQIGLARGERTEKRPIVPCSGFRTRTNDKVRRVDRAVQGCWTAPRCATLLRLKLLRCTHGYKCLIW